MILFCTALKEEREAVRRAWGTSFSGSLRGLEFDLGEDCALVCSGVGANRVERAVSVGTSVYNPKLTVLVGFSAGLKTSGRVGDLFWDQRGDQDLGARFSELDLDANSAVVATCPFLNSVGEKIEFARAHPESLVADLESEHFLTSTSGPKVVLRAISDELSTSLPLNFEEYMNDKGFPDVKAIARAVAKKPSLAPSLLELGRGSRLCVENLSDFLTETRPLFRERLETAP